MKVSQTALVKACQNIGVEYEVIHRDEIAIRIRVGGKNFYFIHFYKPFDRGDTGRLLLDKDLTYTVLKGKVAIPEWQGYLNPYTSDRHQHLVEFNTISKIIEDIKKHHVGEVVLKMNQGAQGKNVFLCQNDSELRHALETIYDKASPNYDYIAIAQDRVKVAKEYRVIVYKQKVLFAYIKDNSKAKFNGNLSPLHWDGSRAVLEKDQEILRELEEFIQPVFEEIDIEYAGFDVAYDTNGKMWLFEINWAPGLDYFIKDNGDEEVVKMFETILNDLNR